MSKIRLTPYYAARHLLHDGKKKNQQFWKRHFQKTEGQPLTELVKAVDGFSVSLDGIYREG